MELGNISATIVCADADVSAAIPKCAGTAFRKAGQVCTSLQRLYVHESRIDALAAGLAERARTMVAGYPRNEDT